MLQAVATSSVLTHGRFALVLDLGLAKVARELVRTLANKLESVRFKLRLMKADVGRSQIVFVVAHAVVQARTACAKINQNLAVLTGEHLRLANALVVVLSQKVDAS